MSLRSHPNSAMFSWFSLLGRLNLAVASRIYLLEPQWNPSIEEQAIGRALRLGQESQVIVVRYITAKTVEQVWEQVVPLLFSLIVSRLMSYFAKEENFSWWVGDSAKGKTHHRKLSWSR